MENRIEESILREYIFPSLNKKLAEIICHTKLFRNSVLGEHSYYCFNPDYCFNP